MARLAPLTRDPGAAVRIVLVIPGKTALSIVVTMPLTPSAPLER